jgi:RNA polymerase sigma-70 factor (sigma-E family)
VTTLAATDWTGSAPGTSATTTVVHDVELDFEEYVTARGPALVRLARGLLRDSHSAEDVVQDVLARALVKWSMVQRADDPDAYVRRMVVNACTSFFRRAVRREHAREHDELPERSTADASGDVVERDHVLALLRRLPPKQRAVLVLRHYEGLPDAEIADLLGTTPVTVRSNAHRGLAALRAMIDGEGSGTPTGGGRRGASA